MQILQCLEEVHLVSADGSTVRDVVEVELVTGNPLGSRECTSSVIAQLAGHVPQIPVRCHT